MRVKRGEMYAFLGPNGAGKTTTVRVLSTLTGFDEGSVVIDGHNIVEEPREAKAAIGVIQQHISLDKDLTVWENMMSHALYQQMPKEDRKKRIDQLSEYIGLGEYYNYKVDSLSGGWKKRVAIVCALVHSPKLLFLDEPTVGLDIQARRGLWDLLRKLNDDGMTIFLTTHYIEEAESLCNRVSFIEKGKIIAEGTPEELAHRIGVATVEYFGPDHKTQYKYFQTRAEADGFAKTLDETYTVTVRRTNLEDAFVEMTGNKIGDNGFMLGQSGKGGSGMKKMGGM
ncbi:ABC transporter ATP-binding protein [Methanomethylophilus alvi]|uniref:ABC transporter ATP-binding protein n=1 Tax=Methanomethylophilus alvi TaxID=1291540 RepID=UPI0037DDB9D6